VKRSGLGGSTTDIRDAVSALMADAGASRVFVENGDEPLQRPPRGTRLDAL
jgi:hypothetical protein